MTMCALAEELTLAPLWGLSARLGLTDCILNLNGQQNARQGSPHFLPDTQGQQESYTEKSNVFLSPAWQPRPASLTEQM